MLTEVQIRRAMRVTMTAFGVSSVLAAAGCAMNAAAENPKPASSVEQRREVLQREAASRRPARVPDSDHGAITGEVPATIMNLFIDDLMLRATVRRESIAVAESVQLTWPDGSLGCAQPGSMVTQVVTPGYRVRLLANGQAYAYHSDLRGRFVMCDGGSPLPPARRKVGDKPPAE